MMTEQDHQHLLQMVSQWRDTHNDLRFGQWLWAICEGDPFYVEDDAMVENMKRWFETVDAEPQDLDGIE